MVVDGRKLLGSEGACWQRRRERGTGDHNRDRPTFYVSATGPKRFDVSVFEQISIVNSGSVVTGQKFRNRDDGVVLVPDDAPNNADCGYLSLTTFHSWTHDVAGVVFTSASFFVGLYSHLTFSSLTFALIAHDGGASPPVWWLSVALLVAIAVEYSVNLWYSWRTASFEYASRKAQGEIIQSCDLSNEHLSCWSMWVPFLEMVFMNLAGISLLVRSVPTVFHNRRAAAGEMFLGRISGARVIGVEWGTKSQFQEFSEPVHIQRSIISFVLHVLMNTLKALTVWYSQVGVNVFVLVSVAVPFALDLINLYGIVQRFSVRQRLWRQLRKSLSTSNGQSRFAVRHLLKKHFGVIEAAEPWEKSPLVSSDEYTNLETIASRLEASLEDVQHEMTVLEQGQKLHHGEAQRLLEMGRRRLREAAFPCFFEVAEHGQAQAGAFPRSFGPFTTELLQGFAPQFVCAAGKPTLWRDNTEDFHLSPIGKVTLEAKEKEAAGISQNASWFAWSYGHGTGSSGKPHGDRPDAFSQLCRLGGYMYFDDSLQLTQVLTVAHKCQDNLPNQGSLYFHKPIGIANDTPLAMLLEEVDRSDSGMPAICPGVIEDEFPGLRMVWVPARDIDSETHCHGGFLFFHCTSAGRSRRL